MGSVPWNKGKKGVMPTPWNKGLKTGLKPHNYIDIPKEKFIPLIKEGMNSEEIGESLNINKATVIKKMHKYELFDMYQEKANRWKTQDIINNGLTCTKCNLHCDYEDRLEHFYYTSTKDETLRSSYNSICRPCQAKRSSELYINKRLKENPDYVTESMLFVSDTHKECKTCRNVKSRSDYNIAKGNKDGYSSHCKDCETKARLDTYRDDMVKTKYKQYKSIMRSEDNDCDLTYEEFEAMWPKDNRCPIRRDIVFQFYPQEDRHLWSKGGRHWPFTPTIDHLFPDKPLCKDNFWVISWRANETKSDMFVAEIEALYHAIQQRRGKHYIGSDYLEVLEVERKIDDIKEYVGKYSPKHLESIKTHRKL